MRYSLSLNMQDETNQPQPYREPYSPTQPVPEQPMPKGDGWRSALSTIMILILAPLIGLGLTTFVFQSYEVDGPSMETTLQNRDRLIVFKLPRTISRITRKQYVPSRGEVIVFARKGMIDFGDGGEK